MPANTPEEIPALLAAAMNAGDLDAFIDLHEHDPTTSVPPDGHVASGTAEIRRAPEPIFATGPKIENEVVGTLENDGLALTRPGIRLHRPRLLPTRLLARHMVEVQDAGLPSDPTGYR